MERYVLIEMGSRKGRAELANWRRRQSWGKRGPRATIRPEKSGGSSPQR